MAMMLRACPLARLRDVHLVSSFKGLSLKSNSTSVSFSAVQVTPACKKLVVQPMAAAGYKLKSHKWHLVALVRLPIVDKFVLAYGNASGVGHVRQALEGVGLASAKRFGVTGSGKITRRCAGRAHLLRKKSTKRKNRLAGKTEVKHCDWQNVIGALPYLKTKKQ
uniref:50S ribosomal protein L35 n=2 Tax=Physcomitrium patens TaxID=3218 RepID=A0A7I4C7H0_PHYPA|nr:50S ribosomal protein L35, chloroplastic-like [Physcomitrium patens]|eukprot:XP_024359953.1 50S ribosomal protein L35, chloroplastic-like [Physcomitrella patens]